MEIQQIQQIGIIGLGLIGGSLAKTIRRVHPATRIIACDTDIATLEQAQKDGIIHRGTRFIDPSFGECRYLFLCAHVQKNLELLHAIAPYLNDSCTLTDMGSVKSDIHHTMKELGLSNYFIGGHPMAGSEKSGYEYATPFLFENAYYIITHEDIPSSQVREFEIYLSSLGCLPLVTSPRHHDFLTAAVSHLPHILAASLVNLVAKLDDSSQHMKSIAAGGFKDITRIASSSPRMWEEICRSNESQIRKVLEAFQDSLADMQEELIHPHGHSLLDFFQDAKNFRDSLPITSTGGIPRVNEIYCDLIDEVGGIAAISALLAVRQVSIKNIGIIHNREFEEGVLRIEFYKKEAMASAIENLRKHGYQVYER